MKRCLIVDDEPLARDIIESYVKKIPDLEIAGRCDNALDAGRILHNGRVDLIFLDIEMPDLTGLDFLKTLDHPPAVIITTAHREYALEGYELDVTDYLLKPISFERFLKAVHKFFRLLQPAVNPPENEYSNDNADAFIYLKEDRKVKKVRLDEILYIESMRDYCRFQTKSEKITTKTTLSGLEEKLPRDKFLRIHRSFIVAIDKITAFTPVSVEIGKKELVIGRSYQQMVAKTLGYEST